MSRSIKKAPYKVRKWLRSPKGRKAAIIRGSRFKGIPPDPWDDIRISKDAMFINRYITIMHKKGYSREKIDKLLVKKFKITHASAHERTERRCG